MAYPTQPGYGYPPPAGDPLWPYFSQVAGQDGQIDAEELQKCLTASGIGGTYEPFSKDTCRIMIAMLDRDRSGKMGFTEFKELWTALNQWKTTFMGVDRDRSGAVDGGELQQCLAGFGYRLSPQAIGAITARYSTNGQIRFDEFVALNVRLRVLTTQFQQRDVQRNGNATFNFDDFIAVVMGI